jgi:hypothetical protein
MAIGQQLLDVPMGDMIRQMAFAIADAQHELDESSMRVAEMMSGQMVVRDDEGRPVAKNGVPEVIDTRVFFGTEKKPDGTVEPARVSMMELGFTPNFYQFIDTIIEVKIAIKITREVERTKTVKDTDTATRSRTVKRSEVTKSYLGVSTTTVDASYSSKYSYSAEGSSLLRTKLVPVPAPAMLEERIRRLLDAQQAEAQKAAPAKAG